MFLYPDDLSCCRANQSNTSILVPAVSGTGNLIKKLISLETKIMNAQNHHSPEPVFTPTSVPPAVEKAQAEVLESHTVSDGMLNLAFGQVREVQPEAESKIETPKAISGEAKSEYVPFYERFADHLTKLDPISRLGGGAFAGLAVADMLLAATCTVPNGPLIHMAFAGLNSLLAYFYLSGARDGLSAR